MNKDDSETVEPVPYDDAPAVDWFLQHLVQAVNGLPESTIPVILNVHGLVIAGELISGHRYFVEQGKRFKAKDGKPYQETLSRFERIADDTYPSAVGGGDDDRPPGFVHLRNAHIYASGQSPMPKKDGAWWRGRLCAIDGFIMGSFAPAPD